MKLSLVRLAGKVRRWLVPAALSAATFVGSLGISSVASAQEGARFHSGAPAVAPGRPGVLPGRGSPAFRPYHRRFWGPGPVAHPWRHWRAPGWRGAGRFHGGGRGWVHGGGRGGFHGGGRGFRR